VRVAAALALAVTLGAAAGCGVKGPPRPAGAPEKPAPPAPRDTIQAAPPAQPAPEGAK
jgi:hypothetical protein